MSDEAPVSGADGSSLVELLAAAGNTHADRVALRTGGRAFTFSSLYAAADRTAAAILEEIGPSDAPVVLVCSGGWSLTTGLLAIIKTGHPYVVLEATTPPERAGFIVADATAALLVSDDGGRHLADRVAGDRPVLALEQTSKHDAGPVWIEVPGDRPLGLLYTSGSTGEPKGVIRSHDNGRESLRHDDARFLVPGHRFGVLWSAAAWVTGGQLLPPLVNGASLSIHDPRIDVDGIPGLVRWLQDEQISTLSIVSSVLRLLLDALPSGLVFPDLERVLVGGDALRWRDVARLRPHLRSGAQIVHRWGMSEAGAVTRYIVPDGPVPDEGIVPVGRCWPGREIAIIGDDGRELPTGETGRILVRGRHLASGYWGRPEATARAFHYNEDGSQEVVTSDLGRRDSDGTLTLVGRDDEMVKISGQRVDPAEVERALRRLAPITEAAAVPVTARGQTALIAYVVLTDTEALDPARWRKALSQTLPVHMLPARFIAVPSLPLLPSGKTDRRSLVDRAEELLTSATASNGRAPADDLERHLCRLWQAALGVEIIGTSDDFFEFGGSSLQAARLFGQIHRELGYDLGLSLLLENPTVAQLAAAIRRGDTDAWRCVVPIREEGDEIPLFVAHGQYGNIISARRLASRLAPGRPVYGIQAETLDGRPPRARTIPDMAARYVGEILTTRPQGPYLLFGFSFGGLLALEIARKLKEKGHEVPLVVLGDTVLPPTATAAATEPPGSLGRRLSRHRVNLRVGDRGLLSYLVWRGSTRLKLLGRRIALAAWATTGRPLPPRLRPAGVQRACRNAVASHRVEPYDGRVVLLRAASPDPEPDLGWSRVLGQDVTVVPIPGTHDRIMTEPAVARELERCIDEAFSGHPG